MAKAIEWGYHRATWFLRTLPNAIILGAMRSGTTSLHRWLVSHPEIRGGLNKEVHFFDLHWHRGVAWYRSKFPLERGNVMLEATPYYLFHPFVPERLAATIPDCRLIVLLRNPVDRAVSHYRHSVRNGHEMLEFQDAIKAEDARLGGLDLQELEHIRQHQRFSYLARGRYAEQLMRWLEFFPKDQLLVLQSERLFAESSELLQRVHRFLGVSMQRPRSLHNVNPSSADPLDSSLRRQLEAYFAPHNARLFDLLNEEFSW